MKSEILEMKSPSLQILFWLAITFLPTITVDAEDATRLDQDHLLQYRDTNGNVQPVRTKTDWEIRRASIVKGMTTIMGKLPGDNRRAPLAIQQLEEHDAGTYIRRLITYQSEPKSRTPAYLCIPKDVLAGKRRANAVLCLHPTNGDVGHQVVLGIAGQTGRAYAAELAQAGYVTLSPSYPQMANYWPNLSELGYASGTMKAIWDNIRGIDLLAAFPFVDHSNGFAAIGHSLGGHNAIFTAAFEPRITVLAISCGFDAFPDYFKGIEKKWLAGAGWCQTCYMPRLANYRGQLNQIPFDFPELLGALAPRRLFVNAPLGDGNFRWQSVDRCAAAARPIYKLIGSEDDLIIKHPDCGHDFPEPLRQAAYRTIASVLHPEES